MSFFKALLSSVLLFCYSLSANWENQWIEALKDFNDEKLFEAKERFNIAIDTMEKENKENLYIYADRAKVHIFLENFSDALIDLDKVLSSNALEGDDFIQALVNRIIAKSRLGVNFLDDLEIFGKTYNRIPIFENTENHIFIRNVPECECAKNLLISFFQNEMCLSREDIFLLKSGMLIIKKNYENCKFRTENYEKKQNQSAVEACNSWCDLNAISAGAWCGRVFKRPDCVAACLAAVYVVQKGCYWCCSEGDFYKKCIEPFGRVVDFMNKPCKPYKE